MTGEESSSWPSSYNSRSLKDLMTLRHLPEVVECNGSLTGWLSKMVSKMNRMNLDSHNTMVAMTDLRNLVTGESLR